MSGLVPVLSLLAGMGLGFAFGWMVLRAQSQHAADVARVEGQDERAKLSALLEAANWQLANEREIRTGLKEDITRIGQQLLSESRGRATAESQASQVSRFEARNQDLEARLAGATDAVSGLKARERQLATELQHEKSQAAEKLALLQEARGELADAFKALASDSLSANSRSFLTLAETAFSRVQEAAKGDLEIAARVRGGCQAREGIAGQGRGEHPGHGEGTHRGLRGPQGTVPIALGLASPVTDGNRQSGQGDSGCQRCAADGRDPVETSRRMAGMLENCDFEEQPSVDTEEGRRRPDMIIRLPAGKRIIIDAKVPLSAPSRPSRRPTRTPPGSGSRSTLDDSAAT